MGSRYGSCRPTFAWLQAMAVLTGLLTTAPRPCQATHGFRLAYGQSLDQYVTSSTTLNLNVYWDQTTVSMNVTALLDGEAFNYTTLIQATNVTLGRVLFQIVGLSLSVGSHTLDMTLTPESGDPDTLLVTVHNLRPVTSLTVTGLNSTRNMWVAVDTSLTLNAQVPSSAYPLIADWTVNNALLAKQNYSNGETSLSYVHKWGTPGAYSFNLTVFYGISSQSVNFILNIVHPINGISVSEKTISSEPDVDITLRILFTNAMVVHMGPVRYWVDWEDGSAAVEDALNIVAGSFQDLQHNYTVQGNYSVTLKLTSEVDVQTFSVLAAMWDELSGLGMTVSPTASQPGDKLNVTLINTPTHNFRFVIDCGNGREERNGDVDYAVNYVPPTTVWNCIYSNTGVYYITMTAVNGGHAKVNSAEVIIEKALGDFSFVMADSVIPFPEGILNMPVSVNGNTGTPSGFCSWNFGVVGETIQSVYLNRPIDWPVVKTFQYSTPGFYDVQFSCYNNISSMMLNATIEVRDWVMADFVVVVNNPQVMDGMTPVSDTLINITLLTIVRPPSGLVANFSYGDGDSEYISITRWETYHKYPARVVYTGSVFLSHPEKGTITLGFVVRQGAFQVSVDREGGVVDIQTVTFTVEVPGPFTGNVVVKFGDKKTNTKTMNVQNQTTYSVGHTYEAVGDYKPSIEGQDINKQYTETMHFLSGNLTVEGSVDNMVLEVTPGNTEYPPGDVVATVTLERPKHVIRNMHCFIDFHEELDPGIHNWSGGLQLGASFSIPFKYITLGGKTATVNCSDLYSSQFLLASVMVTNPCFSIDPIFDRQYGVESRAMVVSNSKSLRLVTRTVILCTDTNPDFDWHVDRVGVGELPDFKQPFVDFLTFGPGELEPGLYKMTLNISFGPEHDSIWIKESTFVRIIRVPLVAEIQGGTHRLTGDRNAKVDGNSNSHDPVAGMDNKEGIQFFWNCEPLNSTNTEELIALSSAPFPDNFTSNCDDISTEVTPGIRHLKIPSSVNIAAYLLKLQIRKGSFLSAPAYMYLQYDSNCISIEVRCVVNCNLKVAVTSPLKVETLCEGCSDTQVLDSTYNWTLTLWNNDTSQYEAVQNIDYYMDTSGFDSGPAISIAEKRLLACIRYRILVQMVLPSGRMAAGSYEFITNCPPTGGNCTVDPLEGDVMKQKFTLQCTGWVDDGFTDPTNIQASEGDSGDASEAANSLYYKFYLVKNGIMLPIAEGGESNMPRTELPLIVGQEGDDYELVAWIIDNLEDYTEVRLPVRLNMSDARDLEEIRNTTTYWKNQIKYCQNSSTVEKSVRGASTAFSFIVKVDIPDTRTSAEKAISADSDTVLNVDWDTSWHDLYNPSVNEFKNMLAELVQNSSQLMQDRGQEMEGLSSLGVMAVNEGATAILYRSELSSNDDVLAMADVVSKTSDALKNLSAIKPYPTGDHLTGVVFGMLGSLGKIIDKAAPGPDLSHRAIDFNSSDIGEDEELFMVSRFSIAKAAQRKIQIDTVRRAMGDLGRSLDACLETLNESTVLGQSPVVLDRGPLAMAVSKLSSRALANATLAVTAFRLSGMNPLQQDDQTVHVKVIVFTKNPLAWSTDGSSDEITSPVVRLNATKLKNLNMTLRRDGDTMPGMEVYCSPHTRGDPHGWLYHPIPLRTGYASVVAYISFYTYNVGVSRVVGYFRGGRRPYDERSDYKTEGEEVPAEIVRLMWGQGALSAASNTMAAAASNTTATDDTASKSTAGNFTYLPGNGATFKFFVPPGYLSPGRTFVGFELPELGEDNNDTFCYHFLAFADTCRVWDEGKEIWDPNVCVMLGESNAQETVCTCNDPPGMTFASSFFVAPNTINFDTVFSKFDITNAAVYGTLIGVLVVWVLVLVWARRKDRQDKERWLVGYLKDNLVDDGYFYLLTVHTGIRRGAGTLSNVKFIMTGELGDTGVRVLSDGKRRLETGSAMSYILATTQTLGDLGHIRIWHDDSGPMGQSAWYLSRMTAEDLQTGERFNFICEKWLALDRGDGLIDRFVPVTLKDEVMTFDKLFSEHARVGMTDTHLWLSCFLRPERSSFTRIQRVTCCVCLLLLTMITSAMFYQPEDSETGESSNKLGMEVSVGLMKFSMTTLWTSTVSIVITSLPILLFVVLFRLSRPRWGPRAKAQQHRRMGILQMTKSSKLLSEKQEEDGEAEKNMSNLLDEALQENPLPHLCVYVTWLLLLGTMATCAFFLLLYSMQWGKTTSQEWLASFFLSFFESIFVLDPVKVLLFACLLAYCARNPYFSTQHQHVDLQRVHTEAETFGSDQIDPTAVPPDPVPETVLEVARKRRAQEQLAQRVFFELVLYIFYVFCVFVVSYGHRDQNTYLINHHLSRMMYDADGEAPLPFKSISSRQDVMTYMNETLRQTGFPWINMLGEELDWRLRYFTSDLTSFRLGPIRVRQVRMPSRNETLKVTRMYPNLKMSSDTFPPYDVDGEETGDFCLGWQRRACSTEEQRTKLTLTSWTYQYNVTKAPVWGIFAFYPSGGYLVDFTINRDVVGYMIEELDTHHWLDLQTRAVFVEMALYNPNVNLFSFLRMAVEFPEVGSNLIWKDFKTLRLYDHLGPMGAFVFICELILLVVVLVFTVKAVVKMRNQRLAYFKDFWQVLDFSALLFSYVGIVLYAIKTVAVNDVMQEWRHNPKVYVDFYLAVLYDDLYGLLLAALVFVATIRLLRILGYNKRITMIATVLARSGEDLFGFFIVFFIVLTAYMATGVILFASHMYQFRSVWDTYCTLYMVLLGKNVLGRFIGAAPLWAQVYYCSLTVLVIFILYTMFQAILCNTTSVVRSNIETVPPPYGLVNVLHNFYRAAVADWVPAWLVNKQAVAPVDKAATAGLKPGYLPQPSSGPAYYQKDDRTQPHRVLATLAEHFNRHYQAEEKRNRRRKKAAFTNLTNQKSSGNGETTI